MDFERWLHMLPLRWRSLARARQLDRDLDDEISYHLEQQVDDLVARGADREEAWHTVRRNFGGVQQARRTAATRAAWPRMTRSGRTCDTPCGPSGAPGFTAIATLTLALGIGANTAVYSLIDVILLSRLPYAAPEELVSITGPCETARSPRCGASSDTGWRVCGRPLPHTDGQGDARPRRQHTRVGGALLDARRYTGDGPMAARGRRRIPERSLRDPQPRLVADALRRRSAHPRPINRARWTASRSRCSHAGRVRVSVEADGSVGAAPPRSAHYRPLLGRRLHAGDRAPAPGASLADAHAEIRLFQSRIGARFPWKMPEDWNKDVSAIPLHEAVVGDVKTRFLIMLAAVAAVLLIACANVANLSLSRAAARRREISIRSARRRPRRVAQQLITESIVLAFLGAGAGVLVAAEGLSVLKLVLPPDTPRLMETYVSWRALLFAGVLAIVTGCAFGLAPVVQAAAHGWKARSIRALADPAASSPRRCALPSPSPRSPARCCF